MNTAQRRRERARVADTVARVMREIATTPYTPPVGNATAMERPGFLGALECVVRDDRRGHLDVDALVGAALISWPALQRYRVTPRFLRGLARAEKYIQRINRAVSR